MAQTPNKTRPTAVSVDTFLAAVEPEWRREDAKAICAMMAKVSGEPPKMWGPTIIGFGKYHYRYESGREGDTLRMGFSPRKPETVLYINGGFPEFEALLDKLGPHKRGAACTYVKRLADVDLSVLEELMARSWAHMKAEYPG